jgi:AraC-like DNA-binding protein
VSDLERLRQLIKRRNGETANHFGLHVYIRLLFPYFIIFLALLTLFLVIYRQSEHQIRNKKLEKADEALQSAIRYIDNDFTNSYYSLLAAAEDPSVKRTYAAYANNQTNTHGKLLLARKSLISLVQKSNIASDTLLLFSGDILTGITPTYILYDMQRLDQINLLSFGDFDHNMLVDHLKSHVNDKMIMDGFSPAIDVQIIDSYYRAIPYIIQLPPKDHPDYALYGMIMFNEKQIAELMIPDNDGTILYSVVMKDMPLCGNDAIVHDDAKAGTFTTISHRSLLTGLQYNIAIPNSYFSNELGFLRLYYNISLVTFFILIAAFAIIFVLMVFKPLNKLVRQFASPSGKKSVFVELARGIDELTNSNEDMNRKLAKWLPVVKTELIGRVLIGDPISDEEMEIISKLKETPGCQYRVMVFEIANRNDQQSLSSRELYLDSLLEVVSMTYQKTLVYPVNRSSFAVIINMPDALACSSFKDYLVQVLHELSRRQCMFTVGVGQPIKNSSNIYLSYEKALEAAMKAKQHPMQSIVWHDETDDGRQPYFFSFKSVEKLFNVLLSGDDRGATEILRSVMNQNFGGHGSSTNYNSEIMTRLFYDLKGILLRISVRINIDDVLQQVPQSIAELTADEFIRQWNRIFMLTTKHIIEKNSDNSIVQKILDYIDSNFANCDMSLKYLSVHFHISEKYLSTLFKEKTGTNFSKYLEDLRLACAETLMMQTNQTMNEIAKKSGYLTPSTFYKAFKRKYGVTPSNYHKIVGR